MKLVSVAAVAALAAVIAAPAAAHLPPGQYGSFAAGVSHPLFGLDHVLAMVAVGLWAALLGQKGEARALWTVPAAFVVAMAAGFGLALAGVALPLVEPMILASIVVLGLAVALAARIDVRLSAGLVALFAIFHGHAHGGELAGAGALEFGLGFLVATAGLHAAGVGLGLTAVRFGHGLLRLAGAGAALAGLGLAVA